MKIYTKTGDEGQTHRADGRRVSKTDPLMDAVGTVDELNSHLGLCVLSASVAEALRPVQSELLTLGSTLATGGARPVDQLVPAVERMERQIDDVWSKMPPLTHFILPGGCEAAGRLHVARTVCRRAERSVVALKEAGGYVPAEGVRYLNRLSDLLFALARWANNQAGAKEDIWQP